MDDIGGIWRTIGGRRIFIKKGQDLATAMKESGKFKSNKKARLFEETMIDNDFKKFNNKKENLVIYNSRGEKIYEEQSDSNNSVGGLKTYFKLISSKKNSLCAVHNHPNNSSFSLRDLKTFNKYKSLESIVVVTDKKYYCLSKNNSKRIKTKKLVNMYKELYNEVSKEYSKKREILDVTNTILAKKMGWKYEKISR